MAWARMEQGEAINFTDIVSEEISKKIEIMKNKDFKKEISNFQAQTIPKWKSIGEETCENAILAQTLQLQLNKENDLKSEEDQADAASTHKKKVLNRYSIELDFEVEGINMLNTKLSNSTFQDFNVYSKHKQTKAFKFDKKNQAVAEICTDQFVNTALQKLYTCRLLKRVTGVISISKRAVILCAHLNLSSPDLAGLSDVPKECAIKIYKTDLSNFKQWDKYRKKNPQFKAKIDKHTNPVSERERINLMKTKDWNNSPRLIIFKEGVLVMSFIGENKKRAPTLNDAVLTEEEYQKAYFNAIGTIIQLYKCCSLVHPDVSEHNILWHKENCYFVSMGQCVDKSDKNALDYIYRSCTRMNAFFQQKCFAEAHSNKLIFDRIMFWVNQL